MLVLTSNHPNTQTPKASVFLQLLIYLYWEMLWFFLHSSEDKPFFFLNSVSYISCVATIFLFPNYKLSVYGVTTLFYHSRKYQIQFWTIFLSESIAPNTVPFSFKSVQTKTEWRRASALHSGRLNNPDMDFFESENWTSGKKQKAPTLPFWKTASPSARFAAQGLSNKYESLPCSTRQSLVLQLNDTFWTYWSSPSL